MKFPTANRELRTANCPPRTASCNYEQAVYGSFPFRDTGYALLAYSVGCRGEWLTQFQAACRRIGEPQRHAADLAGMMFSLRLDDRKTWMIVGVSSPGADDRGRPDALAFHGLFVEDREFRRAEYDPFAFVGALKTDWSEATTTLPRGSAPIVVTPAEISDRARHIAKILSRGKKVAIESPEPIAGLARGVWHALSIRERRRASVATWAFSDGTAFDLFAAPSLAAMELDASYVDPSSEAPPPRPTPGRRIKLWHLMAATAIVALLAFGVRAVWPSRDDVFLHDYYVALGTASAPPAKAAPASSGGGPDLASYAAAPIDPAEREAVRRRLAPLATRFRAAQGRDPVGMMQALARIRYDGPLLSDEDLAAIGKDAGPGRSRALAWDRLIRRFLPGRDLPDDFLDGPLRWQVDTLLWSFHLEPDPRLTPSEAIDALGEALMLDEPIRPNPLEARYPALRDYAEFLKKLPVR